MNWSDKEYGTPSVCKVMELLNSYINEPQLDVLIELYTRTVSSEQTESLPPPSAKTFAYKRIGQYL